MKNLKKGNFAPINNKFITEGIKILQKLSKIQEKFNKNDTDSFINELRDSIVGNILGYDLINIKKHGFDCKKSVEKEIYLEVKQVGFSSKTWSATFNDTTNEKAQSFKKKNVFLALGIWENADGLLFICYGQNSKIGKYLTDKIKWFMEGNTLRNSQTISLSTLVFEYKFKIIAVTKTKTEVLKLLKMKSEKFMKLKRSDILTINQFRKLHN